MANAQYNEPYINNELVFQFKICMIMHNVICPATYIVIMLLYEYASSLAKPDAYSRAADQNAFLHHTYAA